ncbi:MAG: hypothetical protein ABJ092_02070 [Gillisia sp.]
MKIRYKKRYLNANLGLSFLWFIFFIIGILIKDEFHLADLGWTVISLMYLGLYLYQNKNQYLIIENGFIKKNDLFGKKFNLIEIIEIKKFAGDIILKTDSREMKIDTQLIEPHSLELLKTRLEKLNIDWSLAG